MKIQFLVSTVANKKPVKKGEVLELAEHEANRLVLMGRAIHYKEPAEKVSEVISQEADDKFNKKLKPKKEVE